MARKYSNITTQLPRAFAARPRTRDMLMTLDAKDLIALFEQSYYKPKPTKANPNPCWVWTRQKFGTPPSDDPNDLSLNGVGYPKFKEAMFFTNGDPLASTLSYLLHTGAVTSSSPPGNYAPRHRLFRKCGNKLCVNPTHLSRYRSDYNSEPQPLPTVPKKARPAMREHKSQKARLQEYNKAYENSHNQPKSGGKKKEA